MYGDRFHPLWNLVIQGQDMKRYKRLLEYLKYHSSPEYSEMIWSRQGLSNDEFVAVYYKNSKFEVLHNVCGESVNEYYGDYDLERFLFIDEANTRLLMLRTGTHDGKQLVKAMSERFGKYGSSALRRIEEFCTSKGIEFRRGIY